MSPRNPRRGRERPDLGDLDPFDPFVPPDSAWQPERTLGEIVAALETARNGELLYRAEDGPLCLAADLRAMIVNAATETRALADALAEIARGRPDNGLPLAGEAARQLARTALVSLGRDWPRPVRG